MNISTEGQRLAPCHQFTNFIYNMYGGTKACCIHIITQKTSPNDHATILYRNEFDYISPYRVKPYRGKAQIVIIGSLDISILTFGVSMCPVHSISQATMMLLTTTCHMAALRRDIEHSNECSWQGLWIMMPNMNIYKCLNKMTHYLQTTLFDKEVIFFLISLSIYVGVQLTISLLWFWTEDLPLPEPIMTRLYMIWNCRPWRRDIISSLDIFGECSGIIIWHLVERVHWSKKALVQKSSGYLVLHRTVHSLCNMYGNPHKNRVETEEETFWEATNGPNKRSHYRRGTDWRCFNDILFI